MHSTRGEDRHSGALHTGGIRHDLRSAFEQEPKVHNNGDHEQKDWKRDRELTDHFRTAFLADPPGRCIVVIAAIASAPVPPLSAGRKAIVEIPHLCGFEREAWVRADARQAPVADPAPHICGEGLFGVSLENATASARAHRQSLHRERARPLRPD